MTLYVAYNGAHSVTTALAVVQNYTTGPKVALQIGIPSGQLIQLAGFGYSFDEDPTAAVASNSVQLEIASCTAATTLTAHSTTTVKPWNDVLGRASTMTMSTTTTAYGNATLASATPLRYADRRYVPPTGSFDMLYPSDMRPEFGASGAAELLQFRINSPITVNMICYLIWEEL